MNFYDDSIDHFTRSKLFRLVRHISLRMQDQLRILVYESTDAYVQYLRKKNTNALTMFALVEDEFVTNPVIEAVCLKSHCCLNITFSFPPVI